MMSTGISSLSPAGQEDGKANAMALAKRGRFAEAVAAGTAENRVRPDDELERLLVDWRIRAVDSLPQHTPDPDWPPHIEDPFPGLSGLPEIQASNLTTKVLAGAILHHGGLLVRGFLSTEEAARLRPGIDEAFKGFEAWMGNRNLPPTRWFSPLFDSLLSGLSRGSFVRKTRRYVWDNSGTWTADSPHMLFELTELLARTGLADMVAEHFGERPALSVGKTTLRKVPITQTEAGWHQDGRFLGEGVRSVNLWVTLSDCGRDASGIDLVPKRIPYIVETGTPGAAFDWVVAPDVIEQVAKDAPVCTPEFAAGDALLFDHYFLHRTSVPERILKERYALESWMFAPSCLPREGSKVRYQGGALLL